MRVLGHMFRVCALDTLSAALTATLAVAILCVCAVLSSSLAADADGRTVQPAAEAYAPAHGPPIQNAAQAIESKSKIPCYCRANETRYPLGTLTCLQQKIARCVMVLNNPHWSISNVPCPPRDDTPLS